MLYLNMRMIPLNCRNVGLGDHYHDSSCHEQER